VGLPSYAKGAYLEIHVFPQTHKLNYLQNLLKSTPLLTLDIDHAEC